MPIKELGAFLGDLSRAAKSGERAVRVGKRAAKNFARLDEEGRVALGKQALGKSLEHVASVLAGPDIVVVEDEDKG